MKAYVGYASISEKGTINGAVGNQSGTELRIREYYSFGQTWYFRFNSSKDAWWMADIVKRIVSNKNVGYGQNDRATLYNLLLKNGWQSGNIKAKVNTDCSGLVTCAFNCIYEKKLLAVDTYTGNLLDRLKKTGKGTLHSIDKGYKPMCGDIVFKPNKHVVTVVGSCM